jgi:23S rRNA (cytosine1962-C5)-methyltransferase
MDRARVWPTFREAWIVYDDGDLLAVDKPIGVSSQAADPQRPDDIVSRLKTYLAERAQSPYLGVHQRLDRDTSGVIVFTRKREINGEMAAQFEGRQVCKTYIACVSGWPRGRDRARLRDLVAEGPDGRMQVVTARDPRGKEAVTAVRVLERQADRAMLALELRTGRTHQARVQLAHAGAPIAGDALYGGAPASRLMLHADGLALTHPVTRRRVHLQAPAPVELASWMAQGCLEEAVYDDVAALDRALERAVERRWGLGRSHGFGADRETTAFRLVNERGDALPRLAVDVYDAWLVAQFYGDDGPWADTARRERVLDHLAGLGFDGVYLKIRPKQANLLGDARRRELAPALPARGTAAPQEIAIVEEGMPLRVRLGDGLSTGLFLDQRNNRRRVRELAAGKTIANLFSYTCAFTVAAALGGGKHTVSVDASASALERGRENLAHAGTLEHGNHVFIATDVFSWLSRAARNDQRFDLVVLDPPSYSTTRRGRFVADEDYASLATAALRILAPGGQLLACTNHRGISLPRFRRILRDALRGARCEAAQMKDLVEPADFPPAPGGEGNMKSVLVTVA